MKKIIFLLLFLLPFTLETKGVLPQQIYIRVNQAGFLPWEIKTAIVLSNKNLDGKSFTLIDASSKIKVFSGQLQKSQQSGIDNFKFAYQINFSGIKKSGEYFLSVEGKRSFDFQIGSNIYNAVVDSLMLFFKVQRCGYTDPMEHPVCHPDDASRVISGNKVEMGKVDVTGGWHDAGDYVKFLNTAAITTYTLLFAYDFDPVRFGFDNNKNGVPDILEEAKVGLDWLIRLNYSKNKLITQVQDMRDHDQGWRRPEADQLANDRPAFTGMGKNLIGIYTATMAIAARIWKDKLHYNEFSDKCLSLAKELFLIRYNVPDLDKSPSGMYQDSKYFGKLALGAIELYNTTKYKDYLTEASELARKAGSDFWWSWGDINSFAHYRLASIDPKFKEYIAANLKQFNDNKNKDLFGCAVQDGWGSNNAVLGAALQAILYRRLTSENTFDSLAVFQRDYILGRNQWGVSFIQGIGSFYPRNFHSQVAYFNNGRLPGAVASGAVTAKKFADFKIKLSQTDRLKQFQTSRLVYHDDRNDFLTNEPTITTNATALFVMGFFSDRK
ncbi:MAG: glycoside hydrolase family 9 protein [Bacteroidota bacterium]|nr:glycoside hydrolase family 9 protein [Bacteroidota bacterium]